MEALVSMTGIGGAANGASSVLLGKQCGISSVRDSVCGFKINVVPVFWKFAPLAFAIFAATMTSVFYVIRVPFCLLLRDLWRATNAATLFLLAMNLRLSLAVRARTRFGALLTLVTSAERRARIMVEVFYWLGGAAGMARSVYLFHEPDYIRNPRGVQSWHIA